jgi:general secretion pathway protein G
MTSKRQFTLIELLVVIAIIGLLATISVISLNNARAKARDAKRVADVKQVQTALELYFNDKGHYPTETEFNSGSILSTSTNGTTTYMAIIPSATNPPDGSCTDGQNQFKYVASNNGTIYAIGYCVGNTTGSLAAGPKCADPTGVYDNDSRFCGFVACGDSGIYDGEIYSTIQIGSQCWFAENLNIGAYIGSGSSINGYDAIASTTDDCVDVSGTGYWSCQGTSGIQKYCYNNDISICTTDGGLYEWAETMGLPYYCNYTTYDCTSDPNTCVSADYSAGCNFPNPAVTKRQGICPSGWHIPSDSALGTPSDWRTLEQGLATDPACDTTYTWGCSPAGDKLKKRYDNPYSSNGGCDPDSSDCGSSGFAGLLAGYRYLNGSFYDRGSGVDLWSSLPRASNPYSTWRRYLYSDNSGVDCNISSRVSGFSVRCVKD